MLTTSKAGGVIWTLLWRLETGATDDSSCFFLLIALLLTAQKVSVIFFCPARNIFWKMWKIDNK